MLNRQHYNMYRIFSDCSLSLWVSQLRQLPVRLPRYVRYINKEIPCSATLRIRIHTTNKIGKKAEQTFWTVQNFIFLIQNFRHVPFNFV